MESPQIQSQPNKPVFVDGTTRIERRGRHWAVFDGDVLVCVTVYLKGAREVARRLHQEK